MNDKGKVPVRVLVTAGPTREYIDPVRFISNSSSGKMGYAIAASAAEQGWIVDLVSGPTSIPPPAGVSFQRVTSAAEMHTVCEELFPRCDIFISVAAVSDFKAKHFEMHKIKKNGEPITLELLPTVDILKTLAANKRADQIIVGFAAETTRVEEYAVKKLVDKNLDWIVANDVSVPGLGMDSEDNQVSIVSRMGKRFEFGPAPKRAVADFVIKTISA